MSDFFVHWRTFLLIVVGLIQIYIHIYRIYIVRTTTWHENIIFHRDKMHAFKGFWKPTSTNNIVFWEPSQFPPSEKLLNIKHFLYITAVKVSSSRVYTKKQTTKLISVTKYNCWCRRFWFFKICAMLYNGPQFAIEMKNSRSYHILD